MVVVVAGAEAVVVVVVVDEVVVVEDVELGGSEASVSSAGTEEVEDEVVVEVVDDEVVGVAVTATAADVAGAEPLLSSLSLLLDEQADANINKAAAIATTAQIFVFIAKITSRYRCCIV